MPPKYYNDSDYFFYKWWKEIYQKETDLLETFSVPSRLANVTDNDFKRWGLLRAYFRGLIDGRNRENNGPNGAKRPTHSDD